MIVMTTLIVVGQILLNSVLDMTMRPCDPVGPHSFPSIICGISIIQIDVIQVVVNPHIEFKAVGAPPEAAVLGMRVATP